MYGGSDEEVTLVCDNDIVGVVLDRFGQEVNLILADEGHFRVRVLVAVSPQFFGWVTGIGGKIRIDAPEHVREEYREYLMRIVEEYM